MSGLEKLYGTVKTNGGDMPVLDYLCYEAETYGYSSYSDLYRAGMRIDGYEDVTPEDINTYFDEIFKIDKETAFAIFDDVMAGRDVIDTQNELAIFMKEYGYLYFKTDRSNAQEAYADFITAMYLAGINTDNWNPEIKAVLRNPDGEDIDTFQISLENCEQIFDR